MATVPLAVFSSNQIIICCNYPQKSCCISCHTVGAYAQMQPASQSSQAAPHRASLKLLNALLIPALPWLQLVDPAFSKTMNGLWSLWLLLRARPSSESSPKCLPGNAKIFLDASSDLFLNWHSYSVTCEICVWVSTIVWIKCSFWGKQMILFPSLVFQFCREGFFWGVGAHYFSPPSLREMSQLIVKLSCHRNQNQ